MTKSRGIEIREGMTKAELAGCSMSALKNYCRVNHINVPYGAGGKKQAYIDVIFEFVSGGTAAAAAAFSTPVTLTMNKTELSQLSVQELQDYLLNKGIYAQGKKCELVDRVFDYHLTGAKPKAPLRKDQHDGEVPLAHALPLPLPLPHMALRDSLRRAYSVI